VAGDGEAVVRGHQVLQLLDALVLELDDAVTAGADEVVVVVAIERGLVDVEVASAGTSAPKAAPPAAPRSATARPYSNSDTMVTSTP